MRVLQLLLVPLVATGCSGNGLTLEPQTAPAPLRTILLSCCAQIPAMAPEAMPPETDLPADGAFPGVLSRDDLRFLDGTAFDMYTYTVREGERVRFELASEAFDPLLVVVSPSGTRLRNDDADAETDEARIETAEAGTWRLLASGATADASGPYVLSVAPRPTPRGETTSADTPVAFESAIPALTRAALAGDLGAGDATLEGRGLYDVVEIEVASGETVTVEVAAVAFVPDAIAVSPEGSVAERDDGPWHSTVQLTKPGTWRVAVLSRTGPDRGPYTVTIRR